MSLSLGFRKGEDFYVDDERYIVSDIHSPAEFCITREKGNQTLRVTDMQAADIAPNVRASVRKGGQYHLARVSFHAPKEVLISKGDNCRENGGHRYR